MKVPPVPFLAAETLPALREAIATHLTGLAFLLNGRLHPADNFDGNIITGTSGVADTDVALSHDLNRTPDYFLPLSIDKSASVYKSPTAWTSTTAYIRFSAATVAYTVMVI